LLKKQGFTTTQHVNKPFSFFPVMSLNFLAISSKIFLSMKQSFTLILLFISLLVRGQDLVSNTSREVVFYDVNVIPMDKEHVLEHQTVVVKNGVITALGSVKKIKYTMGALVVDGKGKYLMPGLGEMHAHVPPIDDIEPMKETVRLFALNGITTIRGMLGHPKHLELRSKINSGEILGPHFYTSGPSFNGISVTSPQEGAAMVRKQKEAGYDFLKMHPGLNRAKFDAIVATANEVKIPFAGHVSFGVGIWRAIEANYASIDHMDGFVEGLVPGIEKMTEQEAGLFGMFVGDKTDTTLIPKLIKGLSSHHIWVVPTQSLAERWFHPDFIPESFNNDPDKVYMKPEIIEQWINTKKTLMAKPEYNADNVRKYVELRRKLIFECQKNGVGILLGSDAPQVFNVPGFSAHDELEYLVEAGLTPYQALKAGTVNIARYFKKSDQGMIKKGMVSDLILLEGNPISDIAETKNMLGVMLGKNWLPKEYIESELKKLRKQ
jgi:imidazolonepropionase-like amidohydrolase